MWPALRDRPRPTFMRARPAAARGTRKIKKRQATVVTSVSLGAGMGIILFPLAESDAIGKRGSIPTPPRQYRPGQTRLADGGDAKSTIAASTRNHPASSIRKPTTFIPKSPGSKQRDLHGHLRRRLKYHNRTGTQRAAPTKLNMACAVASREIAVVRRTEGRTKSFRCPRISYARHKRSE